MPAYLDGRCEYSVDQEAVDDLQTAAHWLYWLFLFELMQLERHKQASSKRSKLQIWSQRRMLALSFTGVFLYSAAKVLTISCGVDISSAKGLLADAQTP